MTGFESLTGNRKTISALRELVNAGKLPHAIIIEGEDISENFTLARAIAAASVCVGEDPPCGQCSGCHLAEVGSHPDIEFIEPDGKTVRVDTVREVIRRSVLLPNQAPRRVFIFCQAERLNEESQNALLKTLEEPPDTAVFVLLVPSAAALLDTVISRCTVFSLEPPDPSGPAGSVTGLEEKIPAAEFFALVAANKTYEALLAVKKCDRASADALLERLYVLILTERRAAALGRPTQADLSEERLCKMAEAVAQARELCSRNANLNLLFNNLCLKLRG